MNKLQLECFLKGVKDDSYGEGAERKERYLAEVYAPGHGDFSVPVSAVTYGKLTEFPPMVSKFRVSVQLEARQNVATSGKSGRQYVQTSTVARFGDLEYIGSLTDQKAS